VVFGCGDKHSQPEQDDILKLPEDSVTHSHTLTTPHTDPDAMLQHYTVPPVMGWTGGRMPWADDRAQHDVAQTSIDTGKHANACRHMTHNAALICNPTGIVATLLPTKKTSKTVCQLDTTHIFGMPFAGTCAPRHTQLATTLSTRSKGPACDR
jgi:hypothetical protein